MNVNTTIIGCGWLGLPLALELKKEYHTVRGSSNSHAKVKAMEQEGIQAFEYNLEENTRISADISGKTDVLIITIPPIQSKEPEFYGNALVNLVKQFSGLKQVYFTSSIRIYPKHSGVYHEDFEFLEGEKETVLYQAEEKLRNELGNKLTTLRLGGLFGAGRHPVFHLEGRDDVENPFGLINLVHLDDVIGCFLQCLASEEQFDTLNIVYPEHPWRKEFYNKVYRQHGLKAINFIISPTIERSIDTTKVTRDLGYKFKHSIYDLSDCVPD